MYDAKTLYTDMRTALNRVNEICNIATKDGYIIKYQNAPDAETGQMKIVNLEIYQKINPTESKH